MSPLRRLALAAAAGCALTGAPRAEARVTRLELTRAEPAFGGQPFGAVGPYEALAGVAHGEVDPADPANAPIQDLALAPRNARGRVEYAADVYILKPVDLGRGNGVVLHELPNRGDKYAVALFNRGAPWGNEPREAGDGFLMREGFTLVWSGWQGDVLPGDGRLTLRVPVARGPDGSAITGPLRAELVVRERTTTLPLSGGWFTGTRHASYPTARRDHRAPLPDGFRPTLTVRAFAEDPPRPIPPEGWTFGACPEGRALVPSDTDICLFAGFEPGRIYELVYRARDPLVLGLGYAALRDLGAFLTRAARDDAGAPNPLHRPNAPLKAILHGVSQGGRNLRTFLHLGFNRDESGRVVYEGAFPHVGAGRAALNIRFGQPGRAWGHQIDRHYPAYELPLAYATTTDPVRKREGGVLARCTATATCPKLVHLVSAHELWDGRDSLVRTDPEGRRDLEEPPTVRSFVLASAQHSPAWDPWDPGDCRYPRNPAPHRETLRALLVALARWVKDGTEPPPSRVPRLADGTLVPPDAVRFPAIPGVRFAGVANPLPALDFGPRFDPYDESGIIDLEPPRVLAASPYRVLVPQVDRDGNDLAGVRSTAIQAPLGTHTGWNLGRPGRWEDRLCSLQGSFFPFARTRAERLARGDPRPSLEERYGSHEDYVAAVRRAAAALVRDRLLLAEDAARLSAEAERSDVLRLDH